MFVYLAKQPIRFVEPTALQREVSLRCLGGQLGPLCIGLESTERTQLLEQVARARQKDLAHRRSSCHSLEFGIDVEYDLIGNLDRGHDTGARLALFLKKASKHRFLLTPNVRVLGLAGSDQIDEALAHAQRLAAGAILPGARLGFVAFVE